ncbi:MOSC domain-containing protein [Thiorhodococcus mannitoliphagus]|uniref:MOSC domain-containing protein n=1 Tax=Thiorhodococcus mannitoliphagus TaxID=329406 RepID=A0A6P1DVI8_9GAMM|nr:MOSC domain-containing protein [Thiorhodococcus mannitoliphagus]NEX20706.1 MOSC domain-containing protein [Thiorhodococcus mannitoliphagus]
MTAIVIAVASSERHSFSKQTRPSIRLLAGLGVEGDAHCGATVQHRSHARRDPARPNLRQVHLVQSELFEALAARGFAIDPGGMGENITTRGIDLLSLPQGTELTVGAQVVIQLTGLRSPCAQLDAYRPGLMAAVLDHDPDGRLIHKAGVMGVVVNGGTLAVGDAIRVRLPAEPYHGLEPL